VVAKVKAAAEKGKLLNIASLSVLPPQIDNINVIRLKPGQPPLLVRGTNLRDALLSIFQLKAGIGETSILGPARAARQFTQSVALR
jgi:hypothetical protein